MSSPQPNTGLQEVRRILDECSPGDYYSILQVERSAWSVDVVRRQYVKLSRLIHPDKHGGDATATKAFQLLSTAYEGLRSQQAKQAYDAARAASGSAFKSTNISAENAEQLLKDVLKQVYREFCDGEFENILLIVDQLAAQQPDLKIDRESVRVTLEQTRKFALNLSSVSQEISEDLMQFVESYDKFKSLRYVDVLGRLDSILLCVKILIGVPLKASTNSILPLPSLVVSLIQTTQSTIDVTRESFSKVSAVVSNKTILESLQSLAMQAMRTAANKAVEVAASAAASAAARVSGDGSATPPQPQTSLAPMETVD